MNIISAKLANSSGSAVTLETQESGAVLIDLNSDNDASGGWREVFILSGIQPDPYIAPVVEIDVEAHFASFGYTLLALLNLKDIEGNLPQLPEKAAQVRGWISQQQINFALGEPLTPAPFTYQEIITELAPLITG
jgi:hypothetical protein